MNDANTSHIWGLICSHVMLLRRKKCLLASCRRAVLSFLSRHLFLLQLFHVTYVRKSTWFMLITRRPDNINLIGNSWTFDIEKIQGRFYSCLQLSCWDNVQYKKQRDRGQWSNKTYCDRQDIAQIEPTSQGRIRHHGNKATRCHVSKKWTCIRL